MNPALALFTLVVALPLGAVGAEEGIQWDLRFFKNNPALRDVARQAVESYSSSLSSGSIAAARSGNISSQSMQGTIDAAFRLGEVYCYPNPAKKTNPTFHMETGVADKVELKVYDTAGDLVHETVLTGMPQVIDDGQGPQYAYEYLWDAKNAGSGVYIYSITAKKGDKTLKKTGRCAVIK